MLGVDAGDDGTHNVPVSSANADGLELAELIRVFVWCDKTVGAEEARGATVAGMLPDRMKCRSWVKVER
jgi:hypothetical protein